MKLKEKIKTLPHSPGVYLMKDSQGHIIYVGKSKNLKNRVSSYFQKSNHLPKVEKMVNHLKDFDIILTDTEFEALMLECELIKKIQPLYNRIMKNTKSYIYLVIKINNRPYEFQWSYEIEDEENYYFGPFSNRGLAERVIQSLKDFYKIDCSNVGQSSSPCLNSTIGKCIGICFDEEARKTFEKIVWQIIDLFKGKNEGVLNDIMIAMEEAAKNFEFEKAAKLRDLLSGLKTILKKEKVIEFAESNKHFAVGEKLEDGRLKFFLIYRNKIVFRKTISRINEETVASLKENIVSHFQKLKEIDRLRKDELDEAQIIYSYLQSSNCHYIEVDERYINNEQLLTNVLKHFLEVKNDPVKK